MKRQEGARREMKNVARRLAGVNEEMEEEEERREGGRKEPQCSIQNKYPTTGGLGTKTIKGRIQFSGTPPVKENYIKKIKETQRNSRNIQEH